MMNSLDGRSTSDQVLDTLDKYADPCLGRAGMAASADHVKALVKAHASGDEQTFYSVSLQLAARAARQGHNRFAAELRGLIDEAKAERVTRPVPTPVVQPRGELADLVTAGYPDIRLDDMTLGPQVRAKLLRVLHKQRQRDRREPAVGVLRRRLASMDTSKIDWSDLAGQGDELSHAELVRAAESAAKQTILRDSAHVDTANLIAELDERRTARHG